jgi:serine/threonine-protein kinase RsbW
MNEQGEVPPINHEIMYAEKVRTKEEVPDKADELKTALEKLGWDEESAAEVRVACNEGLANAVIHGNKNNPEKSATFSVAATPREVRLVITDQGEGFDRAAVADPTRAEGLLKTSGRGIFLIEGLMDEHEYSDGGRTLTMVKRRKIDVPA